MLKTTGNGPKPSVWLSRRENASSMSNAYAKSSCAAIRCTESYTSRQCHPQYRKIDACASAWT